eukprot:TRINITY_DN1518_c0_g2_i1.p1 TRINITY_DN1518_c0_g2~~TRINITY_DN1518_c0_g2_i1.p1  ORF type:complete len:120 (-),score=7.51 TRINITY_DN1518_c0_g2_i1:24-383(-)
MCIRDSINLYAFLFVIRHFYTKVYTITDLSMSLLFINVATKFFKITVCLINTSRSSFKTSSLDLLFYFVSNPRNSDLSSCFLCFTNSVFSVIFSFINSAFCFCISVSKAAVTSFFFEQE